MNLEYYDQLIEYYCPGVLSYIYNSKLNLESSLLAILFKLEQKGKLEVKQDRIEILEKNYTNVTHMEEYVMRSVEDGVLVMDIDKLSFGSNEEGTKRELINPEPPYNFTSLNLVALMLVFWGMSGILIEASALAGDSITLMFFVILTSILGLGIMIYAMITNKSRVEIPLLKDGQRIRKNLEDLKKYMTRFKDSEELKKWKNYKIFSLIFDEEETKEIKEDYMHLLRLTRENNVEEE